MSKIKTVLNTSDKFTRDVFTAVDIVCIDVYKMHTTV